MTTTGRASKAYLAPLLAAGLASMAAGAWLGLIRLGWRLPLPQPDLLVVHGPLMICGFLGTLISLERAVALGRPWGYAAPILTAAGAVALIFRGAAPPGPLFITLGSMGVVAIFVVICRIQPALFAWTMAAGAVCWLAGNVQWVGGAAVHRVVLWWMAFLVLTIAGERLELNRVLRPARVVRMTFAAASLMLVAGVVISAWWAQPGVRVAGAGLLAIAAWLARHDVARRTVRQQGLTRFMAVSLLAGYAWLALGGVVAAATGAARSGVVYDALLHSVFLGFVMSMVFAHAPVILPAVLSRPLPYRPAFYVHVALLHVSVAVRLAGDLVEDVARLRTWGGLLNAVALLVFVLNTVGSVVRARFATAR